MTSLSCTESGKHILEFLDGELGDDLRILVEAHLQACPSCSSRAEFERRLRAMLRGLQQGPDVDGARERVASVLERI